MSLPISLGISGTTKKILDHVITYLDAVSSSLATKAAQTTMANNLTIVDGNVDTLVTRVPSTVSSQVSVDTVDANVDAILVDTADMQPKVSTINTNTAEIVVDTREIVGDVNAVLLDTAALDSRLNATWAGRLDTNVSSRLSSAVRTVQYGGFTGVSTLAGASPESRYVIRTITSVDKSKCLVIVNGGLSTTSGDASLLKTGGATAVYDVGGRLHDSTTLIVFSPAAPAGASYISATYYIVEFY